MKRITRFIAELKRRNVFRAGMAYSVLAWLAVQVADVLLDAFAAPEWAMRTMLMALALGFPVALVLAWVYEITVEGVKRTEDVLPHESITDRTGRKLDFVIIGFLAVAVAIFALDRFVWEQFKDGSAAESSAISVAVLPFHLDSDRVEPFFGQLSNDVAQLLRRSGQVRLASSDAVEALPRDSNLINSAARMGVRYLVSGAIRIDGDNLRLSISLFDSEARKEIWADEFENAHLQQTTNVVAEKILVGINANPLSLPSSTTNPGAYELYLNARQHLGIDPLSEEAENLFRESIRLDRRFSLALAGLCEFLASRYATLSSTSDFEEAERLCHRAWTIDAQSAEVQLALGNLYKVSGQLGKARECYASALDINPNSFTTQVAIATTYNEEDPDLAEIQLKRIIQQHPASPNAYASLQLLYFKQGRYAEAVEQQKWVVSLVPGSEKAKRNLSSNLILAGMFGEAKSLLMAMLENSPPKIGDIHGNLATILFFEGDYSGAAELYRAAVDREPEDAMAHRNLGDAIWHLDGRDVAEPIFRKAIELAERQLDINPNHYYATEILMVGFGSVGDMANFQICKNSVLKMHGSDPQSQYDIAVAASRLGEMEIARVHAEKARELGYPVALLKADPDISASGASF